MKFQKDLKLILNHNLLEQLKKCVVSASPNEACGLMFGDIKEIKVSEGYQYQYIGKKFDCIESNRKSPVAFLMENIEKLNEIFQKAAKVHNLRLISIFHSHPAGSHPSGVDVNNMKYLDDFENKAFKNQVWTIMDATNKNLNGFIYFKKELMQVRVEIIKE